MPVPRKTLISKVLVDNVWMDDKNLVKAALVGFYKELYSEPLDSRPRIRGLCLDQILIDKRSWLERSFSE